MDTTTRLAEEMDRRRIELSLEWDDIAERAGLSTTFIRRLRRGGTGARPLTRAKLEDALQWERGSIAAIEEGGRPTPADSPVPTLGELLVQRGLAAPDELTSIEDIRDPGIMDVLSLPDLDDEVKNEFLKGYTQMRRSAFAEVLGKGKPRG